MTDKELRKLAVYIVGELTKPNEDFIDGLGFHLAFFNTEQFDEYEILQLNHEIKQLNKLLEDSITNENYETSSIIFKKIKELEKERDIMVEKNEMK
tara:strand:- start:4198 stop:4485 length:288 start_codon:yes stop_codon:yes gene_type:complete